MSLDNLGDRLKTYEAVTTHRRAFKGQPLIARLDGKAFHTFTRGLDRPFDAGLQALMDSTMLHLVDKLQACVGYTQSDEITLMWHVEPELPGDLPFGGRLQKIESLAAAYATAQFNRRLPEVLPFHTHRVALFDCRAFVVPNLREAFHCFLWRQQDATKNAVSMVAQSLFSHKALQGKSGAQMQEMMYAEHRINFNDFPARSKRGVFAFRRRVCRELTPEQLHEIPEQYRPTGPVERSVIEPADMWLKGDSFEGFVNELGLQVTPCP